MVNNPHPANSPTSTGCENTSSASASIIASNTASEAEIARNAVVKNVKNHHFWRVPSSR